MRHKGASTTGPGAPARAAAYLRVSTGRQRGASQLREVKRYCEAHGLADVQWYRDKASGATLQRPAFAKLQADILAGRIHTVVLWRLDRLARSLRDGVNVLVDWCQRGIRVISVTQHLDFNGADGKVVAAVLPAVAEMEREAIRERTQVGLDAARARGVKLGRPKGNHAPWSPAKHKVDPALARSLRRQGVTVRELAERFDCSRPTVYAALRTLAEGQHSRTLAKTSS